MCVQFAEVHKEAKVCVYNITSEIATYACKLQGLSKQWNIASNVV